MSNQYDNAHQFWCASAATAAVCFLTPRPLRALIPLTLGYLLYRVSKEGLPWADAGGDQSSDWQEPEEYMSSALADPIDESGNESFPASDPPSYSPGSAAPSF